MKQSNFINQNDPSSLLDLSSVSLEKQYSKLSERDKLLVFCKINGFNRIPPTITEVYSDPYYLGGTQFFDGGRNIYDYWKNKLKEIYPSPVYCRYPFLVLQPAIGTGKSTMARLMMAYNYIKLLCMENPSRTFRLTPKPISFVCYHRDVNVADSEFKYWFKHEALEKVPFMKNTKPSFRFQFLTSGPLGASGLGSDVLVYVLSELNFYNNQEKAIGITETAFGRFTSRFNERSMSMAGNIILDSSPKGANGCTEWFIQNAPKDKTWFCKAAHFEVKPQDYEKSSGHTFPVWTGDGKTPPQVLPMDFRLMEDQDPEKVIWAPIQLLPEAKMNIEKFLQDKCGISTSASDSFFGGSVECLSKCFTGPRNIPELVQVDFYDKTDRIIDKIYPALTNVKLGSSLFLGLDLATTSDTCAVSAVQFDGWEVINETKYPKIKVIFTVGITRKKGQETSLFHIFDLITELRRDYNVIVSADQAFSKQILQDCEREGIRTNGRISTDLVPCLPATYLKNLILSGMIKMPECRRLLREAYDLRYVPTSKGYKVDHPTKATNNPAVFDVNDGKASKDLWDSLAQAVYNLKMSIDAGEEDGYFTGINKQLQIISGMTKDAKQESYQQVQSMLESIF